MKLLDSQLAPVEDHPDRGQGPDDEAADGENGSLTHLLEILGNN